MIRLLLLTIIPLILPFAIWYVWNVFGERPKLDPATGEQLPPKFKSAPIKMLAAIGFPVRSHARRFSALSRTDNRKTLHTYKHRRGGEGTRSRHCPRQTGKPPLSVSIKFCRRAGCRSLIRRGCSILSKAGHSYDSLVVACGIPS